MPAPNDPRLDWPLAAGAPGREVWYSLITHPERDLGFWYRYTLLSTECGHREGRLWAALTDRERPERSALASTAVDYDAVEWGTDPFVLAVGDGQQTDRGAHGRIPADADREGDPAVSWQFAHAPDESTFTPLRSQRLTEAFSRVADAGKHWSANQSVRMDGTVRVGDRSLEFEDAPGHQGHTLSTHPPERVAWVHCNAFADADACLEAIDVGGTVSVCLRHDGEVHHINRLRDLVGPWGNRTTELDPGVWAFRGAGEGVTVEARVEADADDWQRVAYRVPDDTLRHNAHCSLSRLELSFETETAERTLTSNAARAEWVTAERRVDGEYRPTWPDLER